MILLPLLDRVAGYLVGFTAWCFWLGPNSTLPMDLTDFAELGGWVSASVLIIAVWMHHRCAEREAGRRDTTD
jgi:hypothetical protein